MPFPIPSRPDLQSQILADMQARIPGADTLLRRSRVRVLAYVWAGSLWAGLSLHRLGWRAQLSSPVPKPATSKCGCPSWAFPARAPPKPPATPFSPAPPLSPIPINTILQTSDAAFQFATQADTAIGAAAPSR